MKANTRLQSNEMLLRVLIYGMQKTRKTWWALKAAEAGFNVILLDGDNGWHIVKQIEARAQERIDIVDFVDLPNRAVFAPMLVRMMKMKNFAFDTETKKLAGLKPTSASIYIDINKLTSTDVLVIDSWTAFIWSLTVRYAEENGIELDDLDGQDWDFYRWGGNLANWMLGKLKTLPCHVIVIGHMTVYEKYRGTKKNRKLVLQREQVMSISGPHGLKVGTDFSDVLKFERKQSGDTIILSKGNEESEGGSRLVPPRIYDWKDLQFEHLCKFAGIQLPSSDLSVNDFSKPNEPNEPNESKEVKEKTSKTPNAISAESGPAKSATVTLSGKLKL